MADAFADLQTRDGADDLGHAEWLGLLVDREAAHRSTKRYQSRMRAAKLRHVGAAIEDVDYRAPRKLDRDLFRRLADGEWIEKRQNLIVTGPCGVGKTWLACALGQKACRDGRSVLYHRLPRLTEGGAGVDRPSRDQKKRRTLGQVGAAGGAGSGPPAGPHFRPALKR